MGVASTDVVLTALVVLVLLMVVVVAAIVAVVVVPEGETVDDDPNTEATKRYQSELNMQYWYKQDRALPPYPTYQICRRCICPCCCNIRLRDPHFDRILYI